MNIDLKAAQALRNIGLSPFKVNNADNDMLLRIPGIGSDGTEKIIKAEKGLKTEPDMFRK